MSEQNPNALAVQTADRLQNVLSTGALARLRRMPEDGAVPEFWRLGLPDRSEWIVIARILAMLTDRGEPELRGTLHCNNMRFGQLLCDGGNASWRANDRPLLSEQRLAQLLAARDTIRRELMIRAARALSAKHGPKLKVNVTDIAWAILDPNNNGLIAKPYYQRLDRAAAEKKETSTDG